MTDHANELRRYSRKIGHPAGDVPSVMLAAADEIERLQAKAEAAEKERDFAKTEIARLHDDVRELTDVRVLDEEDRDLLAWLQGEAKAKLDRLEAAEKDSAHQKALAASALRVAEGWERKCGELRAKIEAMERQEPVATVRINAINGNPSVDFVPGHHYLHHNDRLYLAPGAKGE